ARRIVSCRRRVRTRIHRWSSWPVRFSWPHPSCRRIEAMYWWLCGGKSGAVTVAPGDDSAVKLPGRVAAVAQGGASLSSDASLPGRPETILVVDDDRTAREVMSDLLRARGFQTVTVGHGEEVFDWLGKVDLVLLDAMLPD